MKKIVFIFMTMVLLCSCLPVYAADNEWVFDEPNVLTNETLSYIKNLNEKTFSNYENKPQLGIVIIDKLPDGYSIDEYKLDMFNEFGVGTKKENCGLLFVFSLSDRQYGLEIGDGYQKGSLLRKDLETDFITSDMKNLLREEKYDEVIMQIVKHLEKIMLDEENGVYFQKQEQLKEKQILNQQKAQEAKKTFLGVLLFIGGPVIVLLIGFYLYKRYKLVKNIKLACENYNKHLNLINMPEKKIKSLLIKDLVFDSNKLDEYSDILKYLYNYYMKNMVNELSEMNVNHEEKNLCYKNLKEINSFDNFVNLNIESIEFIKEKSYEQIKQNLSIYNENIEKIKKYIDENEKEVNTKKVPIKKLKEKMLHSISKNGIMLNDSDIKEMYKRSLKTLEFDYEFEQFLEEHKDDIKYNDFNKSKFYSELKESKEYKNYSGGRINDKWMMILLLTHMSTIKKAREAAEEKRRLESINDDDYGSFGSSFGGGYSSGGGFSGGW